MWYPARLIESLCYCEISKCDGGVVVMVVVVFTDTCLCIVSYWAYGIFVRNILFDHGI